MTHHPTPAEIRTGARLMKIYSFAAAQILAEEQAADAAAPPSVDAMVAARIAEITATEEGRAAFVAYLRGLMETHGSDPDMVGHAGLTLASLSDPAPATPADEGAAA